jgi:hypothetical protein
MCLLPGIMNTLYAQSLTADTSCINQAVSFTAPAGNTYYNWNFDNASPDLDLTSLPVSTNIIQGGLISQPSYITMSKEEENYYSFVVNYGSNHLIRLSYGSSPLNVPTATDLGAFGTGGMFTSHAVLHDEVSNTWFIVAVANTQLIRLSFGNSLTNTPTATINSFPSNLQWPHQMGMKKIGNEWIAFIANRNGTMSRFNFGSSITNMPTVVNLPLSNYNNPCYFALHQQGSEWYMLVQSLVNPSHMTRLRFGTDINNNTPLGTDLGDFSGQLDIPRGIILFSDCITGMLIGYTLNDDGRMFKFDFNGDINNTPSISQIGAYTGGPHAGLMTFTYNNDVYAMKIRTVSNAVDRMFMFSYPAQTVSAYENNTQTKSYSSVGSKSVSVTMDAGDIMGTKSLCQSFIVDSCNVATSIATINSYDNVTLFQNTPNPVYDYTVIRYNIKELRGSAAFILTDASGKISIMKPITRSGDGSIDINKNRLAPGVYFYHVLVDGRSTKTFKMVVSE